MIRRIRWNVESYHYFLKSSYAHDGTDKLINSFRGGKRGVSFELTYPGFPLNAKISRWRLNEDVEIHLRKNYFQHGRGPTLQTDVEIEATSPCSERDLALSAFHEYIVNLFGSCSKIQIIVKTSCYFYYPRLLIEGVSDITISGDNVKTDYFEELLTKYPNLISISIFMFMDRNPNIQIFKNIKNIFWRTSVNFAQFALRNFDGNNMVLRMANINDQDIIHFLREWVSTQKYQNLETISIKCLEDDSFDPDGILEEFTTFPYDPSRRPENYEHDRKIADFEPEREDNFTCSDFLDIERESDKKLASLKITRQWFWFCVWK